MADWFAATPVDARVIQASASALKMCYAAFTKGSSALLLAVRALAEREGVGEDLLSEWGLSQPGLALRSEVTARHTSAKAWRFEAEMMEIAQTFPMRLFHPAFMQRPQRSISDCAHCGIARPNSTR